MHKVGVIVINYNGLKMIHDCFVALEAQSFQDFELIIVDNGSVDGSLQELESLSCNNRLAGSVRIISLAENRGFAGGNVAALPYVDTPYIALLNNDAEPDKSWLGNLVRAMEADPEVGICASKMLVYGTNIIDSAGDGYAASLKGLKRGEGETSENYNLKEYVFGACAGAALYRRKMLDEIGFLDEDFFLIHEDTDLNLRVQLAGWKVMYVPTAIVHHKVRSSIGHMSDTAIYYSLRNSELVRIKNIPFILFVICFPSYLTGTLLEFLYFGIRHGKTALYCRAKVDAVRMLPKMLKKRKKILGMRKVTVKYLYGIMTTVFSRKYFYSKAGKFFKR